MVETGAITPAQADAPRQRRCSLAPFSVDASEAPYFVDLVARPIASQTIGDRDINREGLRIYTSLDPDLQRIATVAVDSSMQVVDEILRKRYDAPRQRMDVRQRRSTSTHPQVALVALNPHTGQVLALVGGRNYGTSAS